MVAAVVFLLLLFFVCLFVCFIGGGGSGSSSSSSTSLRLRRHFALSIQCQHIVRSLVCVQTIVLTDHNASYHTLWLECVQTYRLWSMAKEHNHRVHCDDNVLAPHRL